MADVRASGGKSARAAARRASSPAEPKGLVLAEPRPAPLAPPPADAKPGLLAARMKADDEAMGVPVYNPSAAAFTVEVHGQFYALKAKGVTLVPSVVADKIVGPQNSGGIHSQRGLRRLFHTEPFSKRNDVLIQEADSVHTRYLAKAEALRRA